MGSKAERVTRFDEVLFETAAAEGSRQSRSARQQLEHWARLGAALSAQVESPLNRVRLALEGTIAQRDLTLDEARQLDAAISVRIDEAVARADFASAPVPNFAGVSPDRLREALAHLGQVLDDEQQPAEAGR